MLPLSIFRVPTMAASLLASLFQGLASFAVLFLLIMYLQGPRGLSPIHASLLLVPGYVLGSVVGPYAGRLADRRGPVLPATAGLAIQVVSLAIYAQLTVTTGLWVVVLASIINGIGASFFFPANSSAVMKAAPPESFGIASGMLRTFANIGMVFSFAVAILIASRSISRGLAFAIFVGSTSLHGAVAVALPRACTPRSTPRWGSWRSPPPCPPSGRAPTRRPGSSAAGRAARPATPSAPAPRARRRPRPQRPTACGSRRR
jgi:MFS family permease